VPGAYDIPRTTVTHFKLLRIQFDPSARKMGGLFAKPDAAASDVAAPSIEVEYCHT
jgi:hypothetical protein